MYPVSYCALSHKLLPALYRQPLNEAEYELVDANRVCPGIHKVRGGPATRSAVATCKYVIIKIHVDAVT